jgi:hypothetical protein
MVKNLKELQNFGENVGPTGSLWFGE